MFQPRTETQYARVTEVPLESDTLHGLGYVKADIAGSTVQVRVNAGVNYMPGDSLLVQRLGSESAATYTALGFVSGTRPDTGWGRSRLIQRSTACCTARVTSISAR